ncbi:hypothetical protein RSal33209_0064 [Renibacterium salmoninarum ATCC 33209]|uniref:Winged helix DNA-binding domain-containing protein n=2 Tax=Renibacterium salmoninarum TaxID=1646 RepID=A9WLP1_RENSM|nr:hypothetical protein RSal33209_0064 [Renibacterium salmoninarum ATCC 33209]
MPAQVCTVLKWMPRWPPSKFMNFRWFAAAPIVLDAKDFDWALQLGKGANNSAIKVVEKLGVTRAEIEVLAESVLKTLNNSGPLDPQRLKTELGDAVRNLGEEGKRKGAATTLPTALGTLQTQGRIRRVPSNGRLDQQRYSYLAWDLPLSNLSDDQARNAIMAKYLAWTGGATLKQSQWFTAFTVAQSKAALADVGAIEHDGVWQLPADRESFEDFQPPTEEQIQLLAGTDGIALLKRNSAELLAAEDAEKSILGEKSLALQADLPDHPIFDRGTIIGLWQYDPGQQELVAWTFRKPSRAVKERLAEVESYIRDELGDFRSFSLDSPASRQKRIDALRDMRG